MMLAEFADRYCSEVGGSAGYREQLAVLCRRLPWHAHELDPHRISEYLQQALRKLAPTTVANHRRMLTTLYRRAVADGLVKESSGKICRVKHFFPPVRAWTLDELSKLVAQARKMPGGTIKYPCEYRVLMPAYVLVGYSTGLRRGDLLRLRWDEIRGNRICMLLNKTGTQHVCVMDESAVDALATLPRYDRIVFGTIISRDQVKKVMRRLVDSAGLEGSGKYLRRSSATYAEISGLSATLQLGHKTPGMAYRHYVDKVILSDLRKPVPSIPLPAAG